MLFLSSIAAKHLWFWTFSQRADLLMARWPVGSSLFAFRSCEACADFHLAKVLPFLSLLSHTGLQSLQTPAWWSLSPGLSNEALLACFSSPDSSFASLFSHSVLLARSQWAESSPWPKTHPEWTQQQLVAHLLGSDRPAQQASLHHRC